MCPKFSTTEKSVILSWISRIHQAFYSELRITFKTRCPSRSNCTPFSHKSAKNVVSTLLLYFHHLGTTLQIHCDYCREFDNALQKDLCKWFDIRSTYYSVDDRERFYFTLVPMIRILYPENADEYPFNLLTYSGRAYNSSVNQNHLCTSYELIFGHTWSRPPEKLYNQREVLDLNNRISKRKNKIWLDKHVPDKRPDYKAGDKVYIKDIWYYITAHEFSYPF